MVSKPTMRTVFVSAAISGNGLECCDLSLPTRKYGRRLMEGEADAGADIGIGRHMHAHAFDLRLENSEQELGHAFATFAGAHAQ